MNILVDGAPLCLELCKKSACLSPHFELYSLHEIERARVLSPLSGSLYTGSDSEISRTGCRGFCPNPEIIAPTVQPRVRTP